MRILVTNDDGIDSLGLHALAAAMTELGDVTVVAPASEYSGAGASLGTLTFGEPTAERRTIPGLDLEAWAITGPPALCVMYAQLSTFGEPFDLIVSGINPGQNVGWSVYHSGTIGAALTGRNRGASGIAISLGFNGADFEGQTWGDIVDAMRWDTGAAVASSVVRAMIAEPTEEPAVINCNVPNGGIEEIVGWETTAVGVSPPRKLVRGELIPLEGSSDSYSLRTDWGAKNDLIPGTDSYAVDQKRVSITWLGALRDTEAPPAQHKVVDAELSRLIN